MQYVQPNREEAVLGSGDSSAGRIDPREIIAELDCLIGEIEAAAEGSRSLDARIHFGLRAIAGRGEDIAALLIGEGITWPTVDAAMGETIPPYTTSLDAALAGEDIRFVLRSARRARWGAMQIAAGAEIIGWAATEPLARRLVALKSWRAEIAEDCAGHVSAAGPPTTPNVPRREMPAPSAANGDDARAENGGGNGVRETRDWEVLF